MSKTIDRRFSFINKVVGWEGQINATHIATRFQLTRQAASAVLKNYREYFPKHLEYCQSNKAYIATDFFNANFFTNISYNTFDNYLTDIETSTAVQSITQEYFCYEIQAPLRNINPLQVRPILRAIREKLAIDIGYISLSSPDYLDRIIEPHALIFDGLRWHVRAYCRKNQEFRDFTLSRFNGLANFEGKATHTVDKDELWNTYVDVVIEADPRFNTQQKRIIEQDFQMMNGQKIITIRAAFVNYLLRRLRIDSYQNSPEEQQIVLSQQCRKRISVYLPNSYT